MNTPTENTKLKAFIFDVDGTLSDTERDGHRVAFNSAFDEFGINWNWSVETYGKLLEVTGGKERMKFYTEEFLDAADIPENIDSLIPELHKAKTKHYTELLSTGAIPLRPGVERLIAEARQRGYRLAISTTTTPCTTSRSRATRSRTTRTTASMSTTTGGLSTTSPAR